jgi:hypothetical protein
MTRKLSLRKESLTELTTDDLTHVVGGQDSAVVCIGNLTESIGLSCGCTGYYPSIFDRCPE